MATVDPKEPGGCAWLILIIFLGLIITAAITGKR